MIFTTVGAFTAGRSVYFVGTNVDLASGEGFHSKYVMIFTTMKSVYSVGRSACFKRWLCQRQNLLLKAYDMVVTTRRSVNRSASFTNGGVSYSRYMNFYVEVGVLRTRSIGFANSENAYFRFYVIFIM